MNIFLYTLLYTLVYLSIVILHADAVLINIIMQLFSLDSDWLRALKNHIF